MEEGSVGRIYCIPYPQKIPADFLVSTCVMCVCVCVSRTIVMKHLKHAIAFFVTLYVIRFSRTGTTITVQYGTEYFSC